MAPGFSAALVLLPLAVLLWLFLLEPLRWVLVNGFRGDSGWSLEHYRAILASPYTLRSFVNSLWISLWSSLAGLAVATAGAWSIRRIGGRARDRMISFCNMASNFSGVPLAFAFIVILGTNGSLTLLLRRLGLGGFDLYSMGGIALLYAYFQIPLGFLMIFPALDALREEWREAATLLGADSLRYWLRVGLPVLAPSLLGTFSMLFANALGAYATAYALTTGDSNLVPIRISALVAGDVFLEPRLAAALATLLMLLVGIVTLLSRRLIRTGTLAKEVRP
jgi:putative spermidine/putrescine transport system permease protein